MERNSKYLLIGILILFASASAVESRLPLPPPQSGFQGVLRDAAGNPLQGTYNVTFRLFDAEVGGNEILVDSHVGVDAIQINGGLLGTTIGGGVVNDGSGPGVFARLPDAYREHGRMFLEIEIEGETLAPRIPLTSAPYSQLSGKTNYVDVDSYLQLVWESPSQIRVEAGSLGFPDGRAREAAMDLTWDFANGVGELGLDTGMEQPDTWYYLYAVPAADDDDRLTVIASAEHPVDAGGAGPSGFPVRRYVGAIFNDSNSNVPKFFHRGTDFYWSHFGSKTEFNSTGSPGDLPFQDLTLQFVPLTATTTVFRLFLEHKDFNGCNVHLDLFTDGEGPDLSERFQTLDVGSQPLDRGSLHVEIPVSAVGAKVVRFLTRSDCMDATRAAALTTVGWQDLLVGRAPGQP